MKSGKLTKLVLVACVFIFAVTVMVIAQDKKDTAKKEESTKKEGYDSRDPKYKFQPKDVQKERDKYTEDKRPEESYLAKFIGRDIVEQLVKDNVEKIYMLKIITSNFQKDEWVKEFKSIYEGYKKGVGLYYKRDVIYSRVELEKNRKDISDLYKKIADSYRDEASKMLDVCAESILIVSLNEKTKSDPDKTRQVYDNLMRIRIAYSQMDFAMNAYMDHIYQTSVMHYRIAKAYAISIMEDLLDKSKIEEYKNFYRKEDYDVFTKLVNDKEAFKIPIHKADNLNRILEAQVAKAGGSSDKAAGGK